MNEKYIKKLELNKIIDVLESYCVTEIGKQLLHNIEPSSNKLIVKHLLSETTQAKNLIAQNSNPPIADVQDFSQISKLLKSNMALSCGNLLKVGHILKISRNLKSYFSSIDDVSKYDSIENYFDNLYTNIDLENNIFKSILDESTVADEASSALSNLRRKRRNLESSIKENLNKFIHSSTYSKFIMDPIVTIRNDRYVIPIKVEYKDNVKGFVHDISYSGSTVFIEPISIFELNNQAHNLQLEENVEIERILKNLSDSLIPIVNNIEISLNSIANLDLIFAKAKFSNKFKCVEPIINEEKFIDFKEARHPLIDEKVVVPIDVEIGNKYTSLIITGPNTGGKTVTLKTVGLLCLMAYLGLHIPAKDGSSLYVFDNIFADIGDEQSISESLSTFSSHILNIVEITKIATKNSLILLDELGSGTDPIEGSRLAISILDYFYNLGSIVISTTHYEELKQYAIVTNGFENASFEFNLETLSPTYKLLIGIPGKSNAFEISKRLGLKESILEKAKSLIDNDNICIEDLLKEIYDNQIEIEKKKDETTKNLNQIEMLRKKLETDYSEYEEKAILMVENAKKEARDILLDVQDEATQIIKEMNNLSKKNGKTSVQEMYDLKSKVNDKIKDFSMNSKNQKGNLTPDEIKVGMQVYVIPLSKIGTVIKLPNASSEIEIQVGSLKTNIAIDKLVRTKQETQKAIQPTKNKSIIKSKNISNEINVIGLTVDEAIPLVDKYLDDANIARLETVRIVHGKGTGKLKAGIHAFLKKHPHVKSYRMGTFGEGEMGVTVVTIK